MEYEGIIKAIETNMGVLSKSYYEQVRKSEQMQTYQKLEESKVLEREEAVFRHLIDWLKSGASNDAAEKYFERVGAERFKEKFPLTEVQYALYLTKKVFWSFIAWKKELFIEMQFHEIVETFTILGNYFDLGSFYIIRGYINEMFEKIGATTKLSKEEIHKLLVKGAFDEDDLDRSEIVWRHI
jgi:hypothetical protein